MSDPEIRMIKIRLQDGGYETVAAEQVGSDTYKLLETASEAREFNYGTTVEVRLDEKGDLEMVSIVKGSDYKTRRFLLPLLPETELMEKLGKPIAEAGGLWEVVFGSVILVHMLPGSSFDLDALFIMSGGSAAEYVDGEP